MQGEHGALRRREIAADLGLFRRADNLDHGVIDRGLLVRPRHLEFLARDFYDR